MKRINFAFCIMLITASCASLPKANPDEVSLNTAIRQAAAQIESGLDKGTKIALVNFTSPSQAFSEYVLDELSSVLVNNKYLVVVDRANLDKIRQELGFNMSGEVSDKSMQEIGQMLGAQALVTGSLTSIADLRRVMFKVIITETAAIAVQHPADIINDRRVQALLAEGGGSQGVAYGSSGYGNTRSNSTTASGSSGGQTAATPTPSIKNGTYTFYPRLRAVQGANFINLYLDRIVVRNGYLAAFLVTTPIGKGDGPGNPWIGSGSDEVFLQDLDNPRRVWNKTGEWMGTKDDITGGQSITFEGVTGKRFTLNSGTGYGNLAMIFEEIILEEPDRE